MDSLKTLLVANRGEIAVRLIKTAKRLGIKTIAIYTEPDAASLHVAAADKALLLEGPPSRAYLDSAQIITIAKAEKVDAIIPGYGFLSENADFARDVAAAGMVFVGPSPESIESFGLKHTARNLALKAGVPIVPGTKDLVQTVDEAVEAAKQIGYPVMLKATAGGGGMGLLTCSSDAEVRVAFKTVQSRGEALFKNAGLFMEHYFAASHHIEIQVFGNGLGKAVHFGERECSIQRRHQKVLEECPSPFVEKHPDLREKLGAAAVRLAESIRYGSAGTVEYLVDDETGDFFFLEMNTRLQVEHGITELCYNVDLVELMLKQADAQLSGKGGLADDYLDNLRREAPEGAAIEVRVYAENPLRDYAPCPGILQQCSWPDSDGLRVDTWVHTGIKISADYDPLLAKVMCHKPSRQEAISALRSALGASIISGPPNNLIFLQEILAHPDFAAGNTITRFLSDFKSSIPAIDVITGGAYTLVEDYPGRPTIGRGFCHSGPMDPVALRLANALVSNPPGIEGLEITLSGPDLRFTTHALVALCGAPMTATLDGEHVEFWQSFYVKPGQRLTIGKTTAAGCRAYMAIHGGLPSVTTWFGSKSTSPMCGVGGYQGRALASGDLLTLQPSPPEGLARSLPAQLIPEYGKEWRIAAMPGPYDEGYLTTKSIDALYAATWKVSHNAARGGIRLLGPRPEWARKDGGEGGAHPSNVIEYGYPIGTLNWTGDDPCLFPIDCPDLGGFVSSMTVTKSDFWKVGQIKAGDMVRFVRVSVEEAVDARRKVEEFVEGVARGLESKTSLNDITPLDMSYPAPSPESSKKGKAVVHSIPENGQQPLVSYRQGGDDFLIVDYGHGAFDLNHRGRTTALNAALRAAAHPAPTFTSGLISTMGCGNALTIHYDSLTVSQAKLITHLCHLEAQLGDLSRARMRTRRFQLPLTFESKRQTAAITRYMETQRPYASYLPDTLSFVAENNAFTRKQFEDIFLTARFIVVAVGFFTALPLCLPADPRQRMNCPKQNPSRVFTPEGQASWGGSCLAIYNVESPGGYQLTGMTIPGVDVLGYKKGYSAERPWLYEDFDEISFYEVGEDEYEREMALFRSGRYEYKMEEAEFDMAEHNKLLRETEGEVREIRARQAEAQRKMDEKEKQMLDRWNAERDREKVPQDSIEALLAEADIVPIEAPLNANVWKVQVGEGDMLGDGQVVVILEAMKLEINVVAEQQVVGGRIEKMLVRPGDVVDGGKPLMLIRKC